MNNVNVNIRHHSLMASQPSNRTLKPIKHTEIWAQKTETKQKYICMVEDSLYRSNTCYCTPNL